MSITYRSAKGAPLTAEEIDNNFRELETRLKTLETHPEAGEGIGTIQVQGNQMTLIGTFGTDFGTFTLPKPTLILRGKWFPQTLYKKLDLITYETSLYSCVKDHTSTLWDQDDGFWQEILSLPKPPSSSLPLYEKATLQKEGQLGKLAIFLGEEDPTLIFFNGKAWQQLLKGDIQ